jgi:hypothetical protein
MARRPNTRSASPWLAVFFYQISLRSRRSLYLIFPGGIITRRVFFKPRSHGFMIISRLGWELARSILVK